MIPTALEDELTSIPAIYSSDTLTTGANTDTSQETVVVLRHPARPDIAFRISFPPTYPDAAPRIEGTESVGATTRPGAAKELCILLSEAVTRVFLAGDPVVFSLLEDEDLRDALTVDQHDDGDEEHESHVEEQQRRHEGEAEAIPAPQWVTSEAMTVKNSTFVARAVAVSSVAEAKAAITHLLANDKAVSKASHNITAWRIRSRSKTTSRHSNITVNDTVYEDADSDDETAAGGRVLHLLRLLDAWGVVVVVSRWFGGTLLGPERFRCINAVAREVVIAGGFAATATSAEGSEDGKKRGKK